MACDARAAASYLAWAAEAMPALATPAARLFSLAGLPGRAGVGQGGARGAARGGRRARAGAAASAPPAAARAAPRRPPARPRSRCAASGSRSRTGRPCCAGSTSSCAPGERVALMGRNGAGKSTLLRLAKGLDRAHPRADRARRRGGAAAPEPGRLPDPRARRRGRRRRTGVAAAGLAGRERRQPARPLRRRAPAARARGGARRPARARRCCSTSPRAGWTAPTRTRLADAHRRAGGGRRRGGGGDPRHRVRRLVRRPRRADRPGRR